VFSHIDTRRQLNMQIDETKLEQLAGQFAVEITGAWSMVSIHLGVRLGLYEALLAAAATPAELSERTGCNQRLVAEWLEGQHVAGYVGVADDGRHELTPEQAAILADLDSMTYMGGFTEVLAATVKGQDGIDDAFRGTGALAWGDQHDELFDGFDRCTSPFYRAALLAEWLPAIDGIEARLHEGGRVADIGAGQGTAAIVMAAAFPSATVAVIDVHDRSLDAAAKKAADAGLADRVHVQQAAGADFEGGPYDLITFFDSLHDMGDPERVIANARAQLTATGTVMVVEPMVADGDNPATDLAARLFYPSSAMLCTPGAMDSGSTALGNQVPDDAWRELFLANGFSSFRRATETPFNRVFEARP
jgi:SAM-dependent methyltransferase